jgi:hypothetical protein
METSLGLIFWLILIVSCIVVRRLNKIIKILEQRAGDKPFVDKALHDFYRKK